MANDSESAGVAHNEAIRDNHARSRFEMETPAGTAFVTYHLVGDALSLDHAEVPVAARGSGAAGQLVHGVLEEARRRGASIIPRCGYIAAYVRRHPEFQSIVARPR